MSQLDNSPTTNPNDNYNIFHNIIETRANKHLPSKIVKYNKYKHQKNGLIKLKRKIFLDTFFDGEDQITDKFK